MAKNANQKVMDNNCCLRDLNNELACIIRTMGCEVEEPYCYESLLDDLESCFVDPDGGWQEPSNPDSIQYNLGYDIHLHEIAKTTMTVTGYFFPDSTITIFIKTAGSGGDPYNNNPNWTQATQIVLPPSGNGELIFDNLVFQSLQFLVITNFAYDIRVTISMPGDKLRHHYMLNHYSANTDDVVFPDWCVFANGHQGLNPPNSTLSNVSIQARWIPSTTSTIPNVNKTDIPLLNLMWRRVGSCGDWSPSTQVSTRDRAWYYNNHGDNGRWIINAQVIYPENDEFDMEVMARDRHSYLNNNNTSLTQIFNVKGNIYSDAFWNQTYVSEITQTSLKVEGSSTNTNFISYRAYLEENWVDVPNNGNITLPYTITGLQPKTMYVVKTKHKSDAYSYYTYGYTSGGLSFPNNFGYRQPLWANKISGEYIRYPLEIRKDFGFLFLYWRTTTNEWRLYSRNPIQNEGTGDDKTPPTAIILNLDAFFQSFAIGISQIQFMVRAVDPSDFKNMSDITSSQWFYYPDRL